MKTLLTSSILVLAFACAPTQTNGLSSTTPSAANESQTLTANSAAEQAAQAPPVENDEDADGVVDANDSCIGEPEDVDGFEDDDGCPDPDNDLDGVLDANDSCPNAAASNESGCPDSAADRDRDGVLDADDKCPNQPEDFDRFSDADGCPDLDNDQDGVLDIDDKCPSNPEDRDGFDDEDGCSDPDNDSDGILDVDDRCPDKAGAPSPDNSGDGCP